LRCRLKFQELFGYIKGFCGKVLVKSRNRVSAMEQDFYRSFFTSCIIILLAVLGSTVPLDVFGQQAAADKGQLQQNFWPWHQYAPISQPVDSAQGAPSVASGVDLGSVEEAFTLFEKDQSWSRSSNWSPSLNLNLSRQ